MTNIKHLALLVVLFLSGCSVFQNNSKVWLDKGILVQLPSISCTSDRTNIELLTFEYGSRRGRLVTHTACHDGEFELTAMMPSGPRIFSIRRNGGEVNVEEYMPLPTMDVTPSQVLWDIFVATLPEGAIAEVLPEGYKIYQDGSERVISDGSKNNIVARVVYLNGRAVQIKNHVFNYSINIKNIQR